MGLIIAANPLGQMIFSPLFGWWSNKRGSIRLPLLLSLGLFIVASIIYSSLELRPPHVKYWMLTSRFLIGVSSANIAVCRSYLSAATRLSERTKAVSMVSLAQVLGFIVGPSLQAAVTPLGNEGYVWAGITVNTYTACGWINVVMCLANFVMFLPGIFEVCWRKFAWILYSFFIICIALAGTQSGCQGNYDIAGQILGKRNLEGH